MVGGLEPLHIAGQVGIKPNEPWAYGVIGVKTMVLKMPPFSSIGILCFFQLGKILCSKPQVWKVGNTGKLICTSNALKGEACLVIKRVSSAHVLMCLR